MLEMPNHQKKQRAQRNQQNLIRTTMKQVRQMITLHPHLLISPQEHLQTIPPPRQTSPVKQDRETILSKMIV